ncbi:MSHA biogenesis protein MshI [Shewanella sp. MF08487]|uniref:MSHA biogenesis protein MshI n=1 Tax=Shewanella sp. MF08487 TaxID=3434873 RepID=UPI003D7BECEC
MGKSFMGRFAFWQQNTPPINIGVYVCADKLWVYAPVQDAKSEQWQPFELKNENWSAGFSAVAKSFPNAQLQLILASSLYQLLLTDKPNVDVTELPQALLWSVKDMVSLPVPQIHLDYFESPLASNKINVVVVDKTKLVSMVQAMHEQNLQLAGIGIEELAMTNLFGDDNQARLVVSHNPGQELLLTVVKQGQLYMQRRVRGFTHLDKAPAEELAYGMADNLSLEIQRSMDYFESQLRQAPVASIELLVDGAVDKLATLLSANFNQSVNVINKSSVNAQMAQLAFAEFSRGVE